MSKHTYFHIQTNTLMHTHICFITFGRHPLAYSHSLGLICSPWALALLIALCIHSVSMRAGYFASSLGNGGALLPPCELFHAALSLSLVLRASWNISTHFPMLGVLIRKWLLTIGWNSLFITKSAPFPLGTLECFFGSSSSLHKRGRDGSKVKRYWETYIKASYTIQPSAILASGCARSLTKSLEVFKNRSRKNIFLECTTPQMTISSTRWSNKCTWLTRMERGKASSIAHTASTARRRAVGMAETSISLELRNLHVPQWRN